MTGIWGMVVSTTTLTRISGRKKTIFQRRSIWKWAGDRDFYQTPRAGLGILLRAAFKSSASVLFMIGLSTTVTRYFPQADILEIPLSRRVWRSRRFIHATYKRDASGQTIPLVLATIINTACFIWPKATIACSIRVTPGYRRPCRRRDCP